MADWSCYWHGTPLRHGSFIDLHLATSSTFVCVLVVSCPYTFWTMALNIFERSSTILFFRWSRAQTCFMRVVVNFYSSPFHWVSQTSVTSGTAMFLCGVWSIAVGMLCYYFMALCDRRHRFFVRIAIHLGEHQSRPMTRSGLRDRRHDYGF